MLWPKLGIHLREFSVKRLCWVVQNPHWSIYGYNNDNIIMQIVGVRDLDSKLWGCGFGSHQAPLMRTTGEFQTEQNNPPVLQPVLGFRIYWLMMNF